MQDDNDYTDTSSPWSSRQKAFLGEPLHFEPHPSNPADVLLEPLDDLSPDEELQRSLRCELQGIRFLEGKPISLISARLKGPFESSSGWKNPWKKHAVARSQQRREKLPPSPSQPILHRAEDQPEQSEDLGRSPAAERVVQRDTDITINLDVPSPSHFTKPVRHASPQSPDSRISRVENWVDSVVTHETLSKDSFWAPGSDMDKDTAWLKRTDLTVDTLDQTHAPESPSGLLSMRQMRNGPTPSPVDEVPQTQTTASNPVAGTPVKTIAGPVPQTPQAPNPPTVTRGADLTLKSYVDDSFHFHRRPKKKIKLGSGTPERANNRSDDPSDATESESDNKEAAGDGNGDDDDDDDEEGKGLSRMPNSSHENICDPSQGPQGTPQLVKASAPPQSPRPTSHDSSAPPLIKEEKEANSAAPKELSSPQQSTNAMCWNDTTIISESAVPVPDRYSQIKVKKPPASSPTTKPSAHKVSSPQPTQSSPWSSLSPLPSPSPVRTPGPAPAPTPQADLPSGCTPSATEEASPSKPDYHVDGSEETPTTMQLCRSGFLVTVLETSPSTPMVRPHLEPHATTQSRSSSPTAPPTITATQEAPRRSTQHESQSPQYVDEGMSTSSTDDTPLLNRYQDLFRSRGQSQPLSSPLPSSARSAANGDTQSQPLSSQDVAVSFPMSMRQWGFQGSNSLALASSPTKLTQEPSPASTSAHSVAQSSPIPSKTTVPPDWQRPWAGTDAPVLPIVSKLTPRIPASASQSTPTAPTLTPIPTPTRKPSKFSLSSSVPPNTQSPWVGSGPVTTPIPVTATVEPETASSAPLSSPRLATQQQSPWIQTPLAPEISTVTPVSRKRRREVDRERTPAPTPSPLHELCENSAPHPDTTRTDPDLPIVPRLFSSFRSPSKRRCLDLPRTSVSAGFPSTQHIAAATTANPWDTPTSAGHSAILIPDSASVHSPVRPPKKTVRWASLPDSADDDMSRRRRWNETRAPSPPPAETHDPMHETGGKVFFEKHFSLMAKRPRTGRSMGSSRSRENSQGYGYDISTSSIISPVSKPMAPPKSVLRKSLLPSESQQQVGSPGFGAMAEMFMEADGGKGAALTPCLGFGGGGGGIDMGDEEMGNGDDDVKIVLENLDDFMGGFDLEGEVEKARRGELDGYV